MYALLHWSAALLHDSQLCRPTSPLSTASSPHRPRSAASSYSHKRLHGIPLTPKPPKLLRPRLPDFRPEPTINLTLNMPCECLGNMHVDHVTEHPVFLPMSAPSSSFRCTRILDGAAEHIVIRQTLDSPPLRDTQGAVLLPVSCFFPRFAEDHGGLRAHWDGMGWDGLLEGLTLQ